MTVAELAAMEWTAHWIWGPGPGKWSLGSRPPTGDSYAVLCFRRTFDLADAAGSRLVLHVSADSRYRLFVNGHCVGRGPARSDLRNYVFETYDVSAHLRRGRNVLAAQVVSYGNHGPLAEMHDDQGGLLVQGTLRTAAGHEVCFDTGDAWRCRRDEAYAPRYCYPHEVIGGAFWVNPFDVFDGARHPWGWEQPDYDDADWPGVLVLPPALGREQPGHQRNRWRMTPREIALMAETPVAPQDVLPGPRADELRKLLASGNAAMLTVAPRSTLDLTIYLGRYFTGYPTLTTAGGAGASVELVYAEALSEQTRKARRDDLSRGTVELHNPSDIIRPGGGNETWEPIWIRCARFVRVRVTTADAPLVIRNLAFRFASYPFRQQARFESSDPELAAIWDVSWHTALCCAHEHYEDCPFYEQLQYVSDTRLQMFISYCVAGDDSLAREALRAFHRSQLHDGMIQSRYPSNLQQVINTFGLFYVMVIEDHWQHHADAAFIRPLVHSADAVLRWFEPHLGVDGILRRLPGWTFVDWNAAFPNGCPPDGLTGPLAAVSLMFVVALEAAARLHEAVGSAAQAAAWRRLAESVRQGVRRTTWNEREGLYADAPGSHRLSQHTNIWAILAGAATEEQSQRIMKRLLDDPALVRSSYIHDYYLFQALLKVGATDRLGDMLARWREMVRFGFSTTPEHDEPVRSDCHAWSAWPMFEMLRVILGVRPTAPAYASVLIAPTPIAGLTHARGSVPTPRGDIRVAWQIDGRRFGLRADVPAGMSAMLRLPDGRELAVAGGGEVTLGDEKLVPTL